MQEKLEKKRAQDLATTDRLSTSSTGIEKQVQLLRYHKDAEIPVSVISETETVYLRRDFAKNVNQDPCVVVLRKQNEYPCTTIEYIPLRYRYDKYSYIEAVLSDNGDI